MDRRNEPFKYRKRKKIEAKVVRKRHDSARISGREFKATSLGWEIAIPIVGGTLIGYAVDRRLGGGMAAPLIGICVGVLVAAVSILRWIYHESIWIREEERQEREEEWS